MSAISEIYNRNFNKPTSLIQSLGNLGGSSYLIKRILNAISLNANKIYANIINANTLKNAFG